jgi:signal transduction histidine kinase
MSTSRPPFFSRTGTRVALGVTISFFLGSIVLTPVWDWITVYFHPNDYPEWYSGWSLAELSATFAAIILIGALFGGVFGLIISRVTTRRLAQIAAEANAPFAADDPLPGPFDASGRDEIAQLAGALNRMRTRASEVMADLNARDTARTEWVAQVSHDLRTPLAALTCSLDLIERRLQRGETAELQAFVSAARTDTERVTHLAMDLLEIARLEVAPELQLELIDATELVEHATRALQPLAIERKIQLETTSSTNGTLIEADGRLLLRALENLIANSLQHASSRVSLEVTAAPRAPGATPAIRFTVEDDGPGLPETNGEVAFADLKNHRSRADSSGLGLIVTARVAELHGGHTHAENPPGGGARVWFEIAAAEVDG